MRRNILTFLAFFALTLSACSRDEDDSGPGTEGSAAQPASASGLPVTPVTTARIEAANAEAGNWLSHGRTYDEQRFSPLDEINGKNIGELGLAWYFDVPTQRGMEATPIVVDGRMYVSGSWSIVYALDAASGKEIWRHDPKVPKSWAQYACCDVVNRGVAVWEDSVFVGTLDGYLVSIDAATGERTLACRHDRQEAALYDHGRATGRERPRHDWQRWRRLRRSWLYQRV